MADKGIWARIGEAVTGTPVEKAMAVPTTSIGSGSSSVFDLAGYTITPERTVELQGTRRFDTYDQMVRDTTIVAAGVRLFLNLLSNAEWTVNPPEDLDDAQEATAQGYADLAYDMLFDMTSPWSSVVKKAAVFRLLGFAVLEWTAKRRDDGAIGLMDVENRPQRTIIRWVRDQSGTVEGIVQRVPGRQEVVLPRSKVVYLVDDTLTDSPEGIGLYRHLAITAARLEEFQDLEEVGFTTDLRGIPIVRAPLGELQREVEEAGTGPDGKLAEAKRRGKLTPLRDWIDKKVRNKSSGLLLASDVYEGSSLDAASSPSSVKKWDVELLNGDSTSFPDMANAIQRMNQELARVLGVEHLLLGSDGSGSLALAQSKVGTFYLTITSTLLDLVEVFDRDLIAPLAEMNGWEPELRPQLAVNEISETDIGAVTEALSRLATAGATILSEDPAVGEVYDMLGLTRPPERPEVDPMDLSLNPNRNDPADPADPDAPMPANPEDKVQKRRVFKARSKRRRKR